MVAKRGDQSEALPADVSMSALKHNSWHSSPANDTSTRLDLVELRIAALEAASATTNGQLEADFQKVCEGILALIDRNLIPSESAEEPKVFYYKMKSNLYRYLAECATGGARSTAAEDTPRRLHRGNARSF